jgi:N-acetyl-anhydromuramyl-L-alanine amidase AmpD
MCADGLVIAGQRVVVPGAEVVTWLDDPSRAPPVTDGKRRDASKVLAICLHTSRGQRGAKLRKGARASTRAEALARYQATTARDVSWHLTIDTDGTVLQSADLATWMCWHAGHANGWTVGVELVQHPDSPDLWEAQLAALVAVCAAASEALAIPRRIMADAAGAPLTVPVVALLSEAARSRDGKLLGGLGERWPGVLGHCNVVPDHVRGPGDPGDLPFRALLAAGWQGVPRP